eukprot:CAMPEP_0178439810 /NCGR_PEP_ID=MMETSP0689_2-20121128/36384_1 /TAXON_ID=160604 /ORGANISM="Amphidinium massartii, Strain CS-259" /LENGTH=335 /DNA_ID=CAMNT_0020062423 /DNA_START=65 /DNA_END=1068 /DNA_ORIENTATION=+
MSHRSGFSARPLAVLLGFTSTFTGALSLESHYGPCAGVWSRVWKDVEGNQFPEVVMIAVNASRQPQAIIEVIEAEECPFGLALPGQITWPQPPQKLASVASSLDWLKVLAVVYSYVPYAVFVIFGVNFGLRRGTRQLAVLSFLVLMTLFNELFVKRVFHAPRPGTMMEVKDFNGLFAGSCLETCGMPSSHSMISTGLSLDASFRVDAQVWYAKTVLQEIFLPFSDEDRLTPREFLYYLLFWWAALAPVPLSRIILFDHTPKQAVVGCLQGIFLGTLWWRILRYLERRHSGLLFERVFSGLITHNYWHPAIARPSRVNSIVDHQDLGTLLVEPEGG